MNNDDPIIKKLAYHETFNCVQCGYCLPACPTYVTLGKERHSPRGRINLVKMAAEGKVALEDLEEPIDVCLGCRACEPACPTNVQYGKILESAIDVLTEYRRDKQTLKEKTIKKLVFDYTLPNKKSLKFVGFGLQLYQTLKMDKFFRGIKATQILPESMRELERIMPTIHGSERSQNVVKKVDKPKYRIGFFTGCIMDTFFSRVNDLSIKLLVEGGCEVTIIEEQACCGALHQHSGEKEKAIALAKANIEAFEAYDFDFVVNSIGGCGAALIEYDRLFDSQDYWYQRAKQFTEKCKDISVLLDKLKLPFKKEIAKVVTYQPSCHLKNVQSVTSVPIHLIQKIPGVIYKPHQEMDMCCGSAGIYNIVHYEKSMEILDRKMNHVVDVRPKIIVTSNPGCHLQMILGVEREGLQAEMKVLHLVELLAEACEIK